MPNQNITIHWFPEENKKWTKLTSHGCEPNEAWLPPTTLKDWTVGVHTRGAPHSSSEKKNIKTILKSSASWGAPRLSWPFTSPVWAAAPTQKHRESRAATALITEHQDRGLRAETKPFGVTRTSATSQQVLMMSFSSKRNWSTLKMRVCAAEQPG